MISAADSSLGQIPQNHFYALEVLRVNGRPQQKQRLYAQVLAGERFGNALAELGTKNAHERTTHLAKAEHGFRITGRKFYATGALYAQRIPTLVVDDDGVQHLAFVPRDSEGLSIIDDWSGFGQRTTGSGSVVLDNVFVAAEDVVPFQSAFERPTTVGPLAQILHAAIDTGIARAAFEDALHFVRTKTRPWIDATTDIASEDPLTLKSFGHLSVRLSAAEALLERAGSFSTLPRPTRTLAPSRQPPLPWPKRAPSALKSPWQRAARCLNWRAVRPRWPNMAWIVTGVTPGCTPCMTRCAGSTTR